jgi:CRISPR/Cas system-associated endoribonuclease Cas2
MKAEDARKKLNDSLGYSPEIRSILKDIESAIDKGRDNIFIYDATSQTIKELKKLGYAVKSGGDYGNILAFHVSW